MVRIVGTVKHVVHSKGYVKSHELCSDFYFSKKVSIGAVLYYSNLGIPTSKEKVQNTSQPEAKDKLYLYFVFFFSLSKL